ncbi:MAG: hypothetical protein R6V72_17350 [Cyclobacterium sp.]|uniref:hypothetical protein n=1 Tax=unclassified Cyclobacterium TaxID=2615055 RepID=UPI0013D6B964|nr:hypothetical protein [Cyclobacterium sp. SYSU L10401]
MKKLNLEKLKLAAEDVLHRSQLAGIYGGSDGCQYVYCTCNLHLGAWQGYYCSEAEEEEAINTYCEGGGDCE